MSRMLTRKRWHVNIQPKDEMVVSRLKIVTRLKRICFLLHLSLASRPLGGQKQKSINIVQRKVHLAFDHKEVL